MTRNFPNTSRSENVTFSQHWGRNHMQDHIRGFHNTPWSNTPMQNSDAVWLLEEKTDITRKRSWNKMGIKCWCLWQANTIVRPILGAREKQNGRISSVCVCVMWKRQCVPNTIPFSKGKTSISHTHTRCFAYFSKLRHTHTRFLLPSPLHSS